MLQPAEKKGYHRVLIFNKDDADVYDLGDKFVVQTFFAPVVELKYEEEEFDSLDFSEENLQRLVFEQNPRTEISL